MNLTSLALAALRPAYTVARLPLQVIDEQVLGRVLPAAAEPRATVTRVLGTADQLVGMVCEDDALVQRGARLRAAADGTPEAAPAEPTRDEPGAGSGATGVDEVPTAPETGAAPEPSAAPESSAAAPEPEAAEPVDLAAAVEAEELRAEAARALAEVDLEPAVPGDEHHLVGHHVDAAPAVDKAAFAEAQRQKADREMQADAARRRNLEHGAG